MSEHQSLNIQEILSFLPHRYPFLLIDRILRVMPGEDVVAIKNVTANEPHFTGHFPDRPIMPGVLILEAMAQACGILAYKTANLPDPSKSLLYFAGIDNARFKRIVIPGDQLRIEGKLVKLRQDLWKMAAETTVDGEFVCSADILMIRRDKESV